MFVSAIWQWWSDNGDYVRHCSILIGDLLSLLVSPDVAGSKPLLNIGKHCDMPESRNSEIRIDFIARQQLGKHIPAATNTQATID
jgi:hypothetical protein